MIKPDVTLLAKLCDDANDGGDGVNQVSLLFVLVFSRRFPPAPMPTSHACLPIVNSLPNYYRDLVSSHLSHSKSRRSGLKKIIKHARNLTLTRPSCPLPRDYLTSSTSTPFPRLVLSSLLPSPQLTVFSRILSLFTIFTECAAADSCCNIYAGSRESERTTLIPSRAYKQRRVVYPSPQLLCFLLLGSNLSTRGVFRFILQRPPLYSIVSLSI